MLVLRNLTRKLVLFIRISLRELMQINALLKFLPALHFFLWSLHIICMQPEYRVSLNFNSGALYGV